MTPPSRGTDELFLIDGSSFLFRAYHQSQNQDPRYNFRTDGLPTGAVRLFMTKMLQIVEKGAAGIVPSHAMVAFDVSRAGWRRDLHPGYKSSRTDPPDDLKPQMPYMRHAVRAIGMRSVEVERYEADDILATYARLGISAGMRVTVISADKDIMQLVEDGVRFFDFESGAPGKPGYRPERNLDADGVREAWEGIPPERIPDAQALLGDSTDDIPGVKGIGLKTAAELIVEFGTIENLLANLASVPQKKRRELLEANADVIRLSFQLASLDRHVPVDVSIDDFRLPSEFDAAGAMGFAKAMEFPGIVKRLAKDYRVDANLVAAASEHATTASLEAPIVRASYSTTSDGRLLSDWIDQARATGHASIVLLRSKGQVVGAGMAVAPGRATYVPAAHEEQGTLFGGRYEGQVDPRELHAFLKALAEDDGVRRIGHDVKSNWSGTAGAYRGVYDDVMLMSYAIDNGRARHDLEGLSRSILRHEAASLDTALGTGKGRIDAMLAKPVDVASIMAERADLVLRLHGALAGRLEEDAVAKRVYEGLELPLASVLASMEASGIRIDPGILAALSKEFADRAARSESHAHALAGTMFQISSPKQVGDVLFDHLGLPGGTRTATGQWETRANILEDLAAAGHDVAKAILDWRQVTKLRTTYADPLRELRTPISDRVHTTFALAATPTARLASLDPNLQNIPIRTDDGRRIRRAFVAKQDHVLISADYSQVELRILAQIAGVEALQAAFNAGTDIHAMTASEMFGVPIDGMPSEIRRRAKAINFGIIYGISGFGLANQLGIPVSEANDYIVRYFQRFPGIKDYMLDVRTGLAANGYVENLFGRKIHFPFYSVAKGGEKGNIERAAINAPIQSSASDIIRRAMIRMQPALDRAGLLSSMLLQVHDELIFEVPTVEAERARSTIVEVMEGACAPEINLSVPLLVEAGMAANWDDAH